MFLRLPLKFSIEHFLQNGVLTKGDSSGVNVVEAVLLPTPPVLFLLPAEHQ